MSNNVNEKSNLLRKQLVEALEKSVSKIQIDNVGEVIKVSDSTATIFGLNNVVCGEIVIFPSGLKGLVLNLDKHSIEVAIIGDESQVHEGSKVKATGEMLTISTGKEILGRVVDPMGNPLDGKAPISDKASKYFVEANSPSIIDRKSVHEPLSTGINIIDSLVPIGKGQRELIIGDRQTGKTTIAIDTILNQKHFHDINSEDKVYCVYVAIGQKKSSVANIIKQLENAGAMHYTTIVSASASDPVALQYLAPYSGCAIAEYFRDNGMHALIIYDDLSKHAVAYRQISLLLRRPPGREAFPGDIFYLHSKLLERAAKMSNKKGSGSLSALPIIETQAGDASAYIPTNVISITDGQIILDTELFNRGIRPAMDIGKSVSRVGSAAQNKIMKQVCGSMKLDLAQYREIESFSKFGSDLDTQTLDQLNRGKKLIEILKQIPHAPMQLLDQVIVLFVANNGYLDNIPERNIVQFIKNLLLHCKTQKKLISRLDSIIMRDSIMEQDDLNMLKELLDKFKIIFMKDMQLL